MAATVLSLPLDWDPGRPKMLRRGQQGSGSQLCSGLSRGHAVKAFKVGALRAQKSPHNTLTCLSLTHPNHILRPPHSAPNLTGVQVAARPLLPPLLMATSAAACPAQMGRQPAPTGHQQQRGVCHQAPSRPQHGRAARHPYAPRRSHGGGGRCLLYQPSPIRALHQQLLSPSGGL